MSESQPALLTVDGLTQTVLGTDRLQTCPPEQRKRWIRILAGTLGLCAVALILLLLLRADTLLEVALLLVVFVWLVGMTLCLALLCTTPKAKGDQRSPRPEDDEKARLIERNANGNNSSGSVATSRYANCESAI